MNSDFERYLTNVIEKTLQEGGSASKPSSRMFLLIQNLWCFPKYPSKTSILPPNVNLLDELRSFISVNEGLLNQDDCWLGTWINPQSGDYYLDIATGIEDLETAHTFAIQAGKNENRDILALYNPAKQQTIFLK